MNPSDKDTIIFQQIISFDISKKELQEQIIKLFPQVFRHEPTGTISSQPLLPEEAEYY